MPSEVHERIVAARAWLDEVKPDQLNQEDLKARAVVDQYILSYQSWHPRRDSSRGGVTRLKGGLGILLMAAAGLLYQMVTGQASGEQLAGMGTGLAGTLGVLALAGAWMVSLGGGWLTHLGQGLGQMWATMPVVQILVTLGLVEVLGKGAWMGFVAGRRLARGTSVFDDSRLYWNSTNAEILSYLRKTHSSQDDAKRTAADRLTERLRELGIDPESSTDNRQLLRVARELERLNRQAARLRKHASHLPAPLRVAAKPVTMVAHLFDSFFFQFFRFRIASQYRRKTIDHLGRQATDVALTLLAQIDREGRWRQERRLDSLVGQLVRERGWVGRLQVAAANLLWRHAPFRVAFQLLDSLTILAGSAEFLRRRLSLYVISTVGSVALAALAPALLSTSIFAPFGLDITQLTLSPWLSPEQFHVNVTVGAFASAWLTAIGLSVTRLPSDWGTLRGQGLSAGLVLRRLIGGSLKQALLIWTVDPEIKFALLGAHGLDAVAGLDSHSLASVHGAVSLIEGQEGAIGLGSRVGSIFEGAIAATGLTAPSEALFAALGGGKGLDGEDLTEIQDARREQLIAAQLVEMGISPTFQEARQLVGSGGPPGDEALRVMLGRLTQSPQAMGLFAAQMQAEEERPVTLADVQLLAERQANTVEDQASLVRGGGQLLAAVRDTVSPTVHAAGLTPEPAQAQPASCERRISHSRGRAAPTKTSVPGTVPVPGTGFSGTAASGAGGSGTDAGGGGSLFSAGSLAKLVVAPVRKKTVRRKRTALRVGRLPL